MADWTNPITWGATQIDVDILNEQIRDNTEHLKDPPTDTATITQVSYSLATSPTSFTDIHSDFDLSLETFGGDILISFTGNITKTLTDTVCLDILVDNFRLGGNEGIVANVVGNTSIPYGFNWLITDVAAGEHTFTLQWKTLLGNAIAMGGTGDLPPSFTVREVS